MPIVSEYFSEIATPAYWISTPWGRAPVSRYSIYLSGIFRDYYGTRPVTEWYYRGDIGWWNADTAAEEAAEEGFGRVVAIVPRRRYRRQRWRNSVCLAAVGFSRRGVTP
jgi:hypothetical protein